MMFSNPAERRKAPKQLIENDIALKEQMDGYGFSVVDGTLCVTYESEE